MSCLRNRVLLLLSLIFVMSGLNILLDPTPHQYYKLNPTIHAHLEIFTPTQIGWLFVGLGVFGVIASFVSRLTLLGYGALQALSTFWCLLYLLSWAETGYWRAIFAAAQYVLFIGVLVLASGVVEVPKKLARRLDQLVS